MQSEKTGTYHHHDLLLENLLKVCNILIINAYKTPKALKETNWKQRY
jgi:hypothetical protein